jgi:hypothetical protein
MAVMACEGYLAEPRWITRPTSRAVFGNLPELSRRQEGKAAAAMIHRTSLSDIVVQDFPVALFLASGHFGGGGSAILFVAGVVLATPFLLPSIAWPRMPTLSAG